MNDDNVKEDLDESSKNFHVLSIQLISQVIQIE